MIKLRNLKVTKKQENETETETGTSTKWVYTLQDEDKENTVTIKSDTAREIELGEELDLTIDSDQTKLDVETEDDSAADCEDCTEDEPCDEHKGFRPRKEGTRDEDKKEPETIKNKECPGCQVSYEEPDEIKSIDKTGKCKDCQAKQEKELNLDDKKDAIKAGQKNQVIITDDDIEKINEKSKEGITIPKGAKVVKIATPKKAKKPKTEKSCKYWYRGGLCANSQMEAPFCGGAESCEFMGQTEITEPEPAEKPKAEKKEKGSPGTPSKEKEPVDDSYGTPEDEKGIEDMTGTTFEGMVYEYPTTYKGEKITREIGVKDFSGEFVVMWVNEKTGGTHKVKSPALKFHDTVEAAQKELQAWAEKKKLKAIGPIEKAKKETAAKQWKEHDTLIEKGNFPKDILGGLEKDVVVQKHATAGILYAHAISVENPDDNEGKIARFEDELNDITEMDWAHVLDKTFNANKKQINGEE